MKRIATLFALLIAVVLVVAACGGDEEAAPTTAPTRPPAATATAAQPTPTPTAAPTPTPAPKRGGTLNLRVSQGWPIRDTYDARGSFAQVITQPMMNGLITTNPYNFQSSEELIGDLAQSWQVSASGTVITFRLNQGVQWHDGKPFTSKDVAYSYNRGINPPAPTVTFLRSRLSIIDKIETPDDTTVVITIKSPSVYFLRGLALNFAQIMPAHVPDMTEFNKAILGTGPFKVVSEQPNVEIVTQRNPNYFVRGLPYLDGVKYNIITDTAAAGAAFRTGRLDAGTAYDNDWARAQEDEIRRAVPNVQSQEYVAERDDIVLNSANPAFADVRVRQAIHLAFDRQAFDAAWTRGKGTPLAGFMLPTSRGGSWEVPANEIATAPGYNPATKQADIARARQLLQDAGFPKDTVFNFLVTNRVPYDQAAQIIQEQFRAIGVNIKLTIAPTADYTAALGRGGFDMNFGIQSSNADDPSEFITPFFKTGAPSNSGKWSIPSVDRLLDQQDQTFDTAQRRQIIWQIQRELFANLPAIPINLRVNLTMWRDTVKNYPSCVFAISPCYKWDKVWLSN